MRLADLTPEQIVERHLAKIAYQKEYAEKNKEKQAGYVAKYAAAHKDERNAAARHRRQEAEQKRQVEQAERVAKLKEKWGVE